MNAVVINAVEIHGVLNSAVVEGARRGEPAWSAACGEEPSGRGEDQACAACGGGDEPGGRGATKLGRRRPSWAPGRGPERLDEEDDASSWRKTTQNSN